MGNCCDLICHPALKEKGIYYLRKITFSGVFDGQNGYVEDAGGNVTGLNLAGRNLKNRDINFLKGFDTLQCLDLSNNKISDVSSLASLTALTQLDLSKNRIKDFSFLRELRELNRLNLANNLISELSEEVLDWGMDVKWQNGGEGGLILKDNPIKKPLQEAISRGRKALLSYYFNKSTGLDKVKGGGSTKRILILAANPISSARIRYDNEIRDIQDRLEQGKLRDFFTVKVKVAVRYEDFRTALLNFKPNIVHFIGHGTPDGLQVEAPSGETETISSEVLADLLTQFSDHVECVILNSCYSAAQAEPLGQKINTIICMRDKIMDRAAVEFSVAFYDGLVADGSIELAYALGLNAIRQKILNYLHISFPF